MTPCVQPARLCILAYDPNSAFAFYSPSVDKLLVEDTPIVAGDLDLATMAGRLRCFKPDIVVCESAHSMPKQGISSTFRYARNFGGFLGLISAAGLPLHMVSAGRWKKHFHLSPDKEQSRKLALQYWPSRADLFSRKKDHNRSGAALIARFAAETFPRGGQ